MKRQQDEVKRLNDKLDEHISEEPPVREHPTSIE
jgi:hypothetical protein